MMIKAFYVSDLPTTIINESKLISLEEAALFMSNQGDKFAYFDFKSKLNCYFLVIQTRELNAAGVVIKEGTLFLPNIFIAPKTIYSTEEALPLEKDCYSLELYIKYAEFDEKCLYNDEKVSKKTEEILLATKTFTPNLIPEVGMSAAPIDMSWKAKKMPKEKPIKEKRIKEKNVAPAPEPAPMAGGDDISAALARLQAEKGLSFDEPMAPRPEPMPQPMEQKAPEQAPMFADPMQQPAPQVEQPVPQMQQQDPQVEQPVPPMQQQAPAMPGMDQQLPVVRAKVTKRKPIVAIVIGAILFIALLAFVIYYQMLFVSQAQAH